MKLLRSIAYRWKHHGPASVFAGFVLRMKSVVFRSEDLVAYVSENLNIPVEPPLGMEVRLLSFRDLVDGGHFKTLAYPEVIRARFTEGHRCIGVYCEGTLAHVAWLTVGRLPLDPGIPDIVAGGLGGAFDGFTLPAFRGRGCLTLAVQAICAEAFRLGLTRVLAAIHPENAASRHVHEKVGFSYVGTICYRRVLWKVSLRHPALEVGDEVGIPGPPRSEPS